MKEKIYLVCQRNLIKLTVKTSYWSEFYTMSCHRSLDVAQNKVDKLRLQAEKNNLDTVDYMVRSMFIED